MTINGSAQDSPQASHSRPEPSAKEKTQALAALAQAREALSPLRRSREARQLLAYVATLAALAGNTSETQNVLTLLPENEREAIQPGIAAAQIENGDLGGALQTVAAILAEHERSDTLLLIVVAQAKSGNFSAAMRTAGLIPSESAQFLQALLEVAKEQNRAGERSEAAQLLQRAIAGAANLPTPVDYASECGLSVMVQAAKIQESMGDSAQATKTLRFAEGYIQGGDSSCRLVAAGYLQDEREQPAGAPQNGLAALREKLVPSEGMTANNEQNDNDSSTIDTSTIESAPENALMRLRQRDTRASPLTREEALAALDALRRLKPVERPYAATMLSQLVAMNGKTVEGETAIDIGLEIVDKVEDDNARGLLLASKAQVQVAAKNWQGARATVEGIADARQRSGALQTIAFSVAEAGHADLALSWAAAEVSPLSEAAVLISVVKALLHQPQEHSYLSASHFR